MYAIRNVITASQTTLDTRIPSILTVNRKLKIFAAFIFDLKESFASFGDLLAIRMAKLANFNVKVSKKSAILFSSLLNHSLSLFFM